MIKGQIPESSVMPELPPQKKVREIGIKIKPPLHLFSFVESIKNLFRSMIAYFLSFANQSVTVKKSPEKTFRKKLIPFL